MLLEFVSTDSITNHQWTFVNGPYVLITTAVSSDPVGSHNHPSTLFILVCSLVRAHRSRYRIAKAMVSIHI